MITLKFTATFKKAYTKLIRKKPETGFVILEKLLLFSSNPFNPTLETHKLKGNMAPLWAFSIQYDLRIVFGFEDDNTAILVGIGTHDEVY
jgi:mRNA-degrading endonuclease YafQ of YafQ-DinJ toxin-antitoxin module